MCPDCLREYEDPASRRFHAQPNACPACGPRLRLLDAAGHPAAVGEDPVAAAAAALARGKIVAVKGVGGYQLACRADDARAVTELRRRKGRDEKPLALMAAGSRRRSPSWWSCPLPRRGWRARPGRPIVIARRRPGAPVADAVAPGLRELGAMLPSTPLHHLLLGDAGTTLVMTSGNRGGEPIVIDDERGARAARPGRRPAPRPRPSDRRPRRRLGAARPGDSAANASRARAATRRSPGGAADQARPRRGSPQPRAARRSAAAACVRRGAEEHVLPRPGHAGLGRPRTSATCSSFATLRSFREGIAHFEALFELAPGGGRARRAPGLPLQRLRLAARGRRVDRGAAPPRPLRGSARRARAPGPRARSDLRRRRARQRRHGLGRRAPGGRSRSGASRRASAPRAPPGRRRRRPPAVAHGVLVAGGRRRGGPRAAARPSPGASRPERWAQVCELVRTGVASPLTSSVGRLFDAVAGAVRDPPRVARGGPGRAGARGGSRHGRAEELPAARARRRATSSSTRARPCRRSRATSPAGRRPRSSAPASTTPSPRRPGAPWRRWPSARATRTVVLSGGVFQNRLLLERCHERLTARGLNVLVPRVAAAQRRRDLLRAGGRGGQPLGLLQHASGRAGRPRRAAPPRARGRRRSTRP